MRRLLILLTLLIPGLATGCRLYIGPAMPTVHDIIAPNKRSVVSVVAPNTGAPSVTGTIVSSNGYILTSLQTASAIETLHVMTHDMILHEGTLVGSDPRWDLALIKINPLKPLRPVSFGDSDDVQIGDNVVLLGNSFSFALSDGNPTATVGMISALHKIFDFRVPGMEPMSFDDTIQFDAPSTGSSVGAPLFNEQGKVIALCLKASNKESEAGMAYGLSFALPINPVKKMLKKLKAGETIRHGLLGVQTANMTPGERKATGVSGVVVRAVVAGSPAEEVGLRVNDLLLAADGKPIRNAARLRNLLGPLEGNQPVTLKIFREGKTMRIRLKLMPRPARTKLPLPTPPAPLATPSG